MPDPSVAMVVLICGSRDWDDYAPIRQRVADLPPGTVIVQGGAPGADRLAKRAAQEHGFHCAEVQPMWKLGKYAGMWRNRAMLNLKPDLVIAFKRREHSRGTQDTIDEARRRGIPVEVYVPLAV